MSLTLDEQNRIQEALEDMAHEEVVNNSPDYHDYVINYRAKEASYICACLSDMDDIEATRTAIAIEHDYLRYRIDSMGQNEYDDFVYNLLGPVYTEDEYDPDDMRFTYE